MGFMKKIFGGMPGTDDHGAISSESPEEHEPGHTMGLNPGDGASQDEAEAEETRH
jgi:hypothetical protein